jgi:S1/P1 Nuclease
MRIAAVVLLLVPLTAFAWNNTGHETVAAIAWDNMTPAARQKAVAVLNGAKKCDCLRELAGSDARSFFILAATWPDVVRSNDQKDANGHLIAEDPRVCTVFHEPSEHFRDRYFSGTSGATQDRPEIPIAPQNSIERLKKFAPLVACRSAATCAAEPSDRAHDLAWILHLVGDVHQPLHNASRVTPELPKGDEGGNKFPLQGKPSKLHSFWDDILSMTIPKNAGEDEIAYITRVSQRIEHDHPRAAVTAAKLESQQFEKWSDEGFALAKQVAYPAALVANPTPSPAYRQAVFDTADAQVALAGYRLADLLNDMFR